MKINETTKTSSLAATVAIAATLAANSLGVGGITQDQIDQLNSDAQIWAQEQQDVAYMESDDYKIERLTFNIAKNQIEVSILTTDIYNTIVPILDFCGIEEVCSEVENDISCEMIDGCKKGIFTPDQIVQIKSRDEAQKNYNATESRISLLINNINKWTAKKDELQNL